MTAATAKAQIFTTEDTEAHRLYGESLVISLYILCASVSSVVKIWAFAVDTEAHRLYREILVISFLLAWPQTWEISVVEFPFALLPESAPAPPARFAAQPAVCG